MLKQIHQLYIRSIAAFIWLNEKVFFYPALRDFYKKQFDKNTANTILDIGANRGQSIRFFRDIFLHSTIHSFEPNPKLFQILVKDFSQPGIYLYQKGISSCTGRKIFYEHILDETSGFEQAATDSDYNKLKNRILLTNTQQSIQSSYEVSVSTLDDFIASAIIEKIDILKIDVEGHEADVLQGATQLLTEKLVRFIQLERHYDDQYALSHKAIDEMLANAGYVEYYRQKHGFGNFYEVVYTSAF